MSYFLYITEIYCPWCYGFSPVISKIKEYYSLPFNVICGSLIDTPITLLQRLERTPNVEAFIDRMQTITKVRISDAYIKMLRSTKNREIFMDSQKGGLLFYALKHFKEEKSFEIMKDLQEILYGQGLDVLSDAVLKIMCEKYSFDFDMVKAFMCLPDTQNMAYEETELSFEIMGDVVLYPTIYYVDNIAPSEERRYFISRGFMEYEKCVSLINDVIYASKHGISPKGYEAKVALNLLENQASQIKLYVEKDKIEKKNFDSGNITNIVQNVAEHFSCSLDGKCE